MEQLTIKASETHIGFPLTPTQRKWLYILEKGAWIYDGRLASEPILVLSISPKKPPFGPDIAITLGRIAAKTFQALRPFIKSDDGMCWEIKSAQQLPEL